MLVRNTTEAYRPARAHGYNVQEIGIPRFDTQPDHDLYLPDDKTETYYEFNEVAQGIVDRLTANGVSARLVTVQYAEYSNWLAGRPNNSHNRSIYNALLCADACKKERQG
jgi:hypothetical protein